MQARTSPWLQTGWIMKCDIKKKKKKWQRVEKGEKKHGEITSLDGSFSRSGNHAASPAGMKQWRIVMCFHDFGRVRLPTNSLWQCRHTSNCHVPRADLPRTASLSTHAEMCRQAGLKHLMEEHTRRKWWIFLLFFFAGRNASKHLPFDSAAAVRSVGIIDAMRWNPGGVMFIHRRVDDSQRPQKLINFVRHRL